MKFQHGRSKLQAVPERSVSYHANVAGLELDVIGDLAGGDINLDAVLGLDQGVRISAEEEDGDAHFSLPFVFILFCFVLFFLFFFPLFKNSDLFRLT